MDVEVVVEIPKGTRNKYEADHETGEIWLDRMLFTSTRYPEAVSYTHLDVYKRQGLYGTGAGLADPTSNQKAATASTASNTMTTLRRDRAAVI